MSSMKRKWLGYGSIAGLVVTFATLWVITRDLMGAFLGLIVLALAGALLVAIASYFIMNIPSWLRRLRGVTWSDHVAQLEKTGKARREHYQTYRALTFEDLSTSCLVHLIDVGNDSLLCLYGQHYFDFEPIDDDPELNQARKFPTRTFSLLRHRKKGEVLEVYPESAVVEPTVCEPIRSHRKLIDLGIRLGDGELIRGVSFDAVESAIRADARRR
jgi:hypothetical protein